VSKSIVKSLTLQSYSWRNCSQIVLIVNQTFFYLQCRVCTTSIADESRRSSQTYSTIISKRLLIVSRPPPNHVVNISQVSKCFFLQPNIRAVLHRVIERFEQQSTFHGICHAASAPPSSAWRYMWYIAFLVCLCALSVQTYFIVRRYRSYEKTVDLDVRANSVVAGA